MLRGVENTMTNMSVHASRRAQPTCLTRRGAGYFLHNTQKRGTAFNAYSVPSRPDTRRADGRRANVVTAKSARLAPNAACPRGQTVASPKSRAYTWGPCFFPAFRREAFPRKNRHIAIFRNNCSGRHNTLVFLKIGRMWKNQTALHGGIGSCGAMSQSNKSRHWNC